MIGESLDITILTRFDTNNETKTSTKLCHSNFSSPYFRLFPLIPKTCTIRTKMLIKSNSR